MVNINGLLRTTMIDYPGKMAAEVFLGGCNFRCPFCHNIELVKASDLESISEDEIISFLNERRKWIDGLVISGGEPTIQKGLAEFMKRVKDAGFPVKLDTNGSRPDVIEDLLKRKLVDFIAMDIKSSPGKYRKASGVDVDIDSIKRSVSLIRDSGIGYEFRTTVVPGIHTKEDIKRIGEWLSGSKTYSLQQFKSGDTLDPEFRGKATFSEEELKEMAESILDCFDAVDVRS